MKHVEAGRRITTWKIIPIHQITFHCSHLDLTYMNEVRFSAGKIPQQGHKSTHCAVRTSNIDNCLLTLRANETTLHSVWTCKIFCLTDQNMGVYKSV